MYINPYIHTQGGVYRLGKKKFRVYLHSVGLIFLYIEAGARTDDLSNIAFHFRARSPVRETDYPAIIPEAFGTPQ